MQLGALYAHADDATRAMLATYCRALGIAYQIADDLADIPPVGNVNATANIPAGPVPASIPLSLAYQHANQHDRKILKSLWQNPRSAGTMGLSLHAALARSDVQSTGPSPAAAIQDPGLTLSGPARKRQSQESAPLGHRQGLP